MSNTSLTLIPNAATRSQAASVCVRVCVRVCFMSSLRTKAKLMACSSFNYCYYRVALKSNDARSLAYSLPHLSLSLSSSRIQPLILFVSPTLFTTSSLSLFLSPANHLVSLFVNLKIIAYISAQ